LTVAASGGWIAEEGMERKSVFISSVTRRELARRRPARHALRVQMLVAAIVLAVAVAVFLANRGGF
jgi:hypothetical protein